MSSGLSIALQGGTTIDSSNPSVGRKNDPARVQHAAQQFESLMISEMMKSIRESEESGPMAEEKDQAGSSALQLAQEQFAQALAARGGLGLARVFTKSFPATDSTSAPVSPGPGSPNPPR